MHASKTGYGAVAAALPQEVCAEDMRTVRHVFRVSDDAQSWSDGVEPMSGISFLVMLKVIHAFGWIGAVSIRALLASGVLYAVALATRRRLSFAAGWRAFTIVGATTVAGQLVGLSFATPLIGVFTHDPEVAHYGVRCLRFVSAGFLFYGGAIVLNAGFNGAGDTRTPTLAYLFCMWLWEIPLAWVLSHPVGLGPDGVFAAVTIGLATLAAVSVWLFSKGNWKTRRV